MPFSGRLFPVHARPLEDELLSSWVVRIARAHGARLHTFCDAVWPGRQMWNRDIDKCAGPEILGRLAARTAVPYRRVAAATLAAYEGRLYERHNSRGNTAWIMPLGIFHRLHRRHGLQFCARCLKEDAEAYFRRRWRLAFVTLCERHGRLLLNRCPACRAPVNFHRVPPDAGSLAMCFKCGLDLREAGGRQRRATGKQVALQRRLLGAVESNWVDVPGQGMVHAQLYFAALHQVMKLVSTGRRSQELRREIARRSGMGYFTPKFPRDERDIERLGVEDRLRALSFAAWLFDRWPHRFVEVCRDTGVLSSMLLRDMESAPYWYWRAVHDHLYEPDYVISNEEMAAATRFLRRIGLNPGVKTVRTVLGANS